MNFFWRRGADINAVDNSMVFLVCCLVVVVVVVVFLLLLSFIIEEGIAVDSL